MGQRDQNVTHNKFIRSLHSISISTFHSEININRLTQYMIRCFQILTCIILLTCFQILICIIFLTYSEIIILIIYTFLVVHVHCRCTLNMGSCCNTFQVYYIVNQIIYRQKKVLEIYQPNKNKLEIRLREVFINSIA